jgi:hypothetical protein
MVVGWTREPIELRLVGDEDDWVVLAGWWHACCFSRGLWIGDYREWMVRRHSFSMGTEVENGSSGCGMPFVGIVERARQQVGIELKNDRCRCGMLCMRVLGIVRRSSADCRQQNVSMGIGVKNDSSWCRMVLVCECWVVSIDQDASAIRDWGIEPWGLRL